MLSNSTKYNNVQVVLHWLVALLVLFMLFMGNFVLAQTPNTDPTKIFALRGHIIFGGVILLLTLLRLVWRRMSPQPPHAVTGNTLLDKLGVAAHYALNILVLLVAASGIGIALQAGLPDIVFGGQGTSSPGFLELHATCCSWNPYQTAGRVSSAPCRGGLVPPVFAKGSAVCSGMVR